MTPPESASDPAAWSRVLVYGLGASGRAAMRLLRRYGVSVLAYDDQERSRFELAASRDDDDPGIEWRFAGELDRLPPQIDALVLSPGVSTQQPLVLQAQGRGVEVVAEVELAYRALAGSPGNNEAKSEILAITGTNGKSTTTALTGHLLRGAGFRVEVCGNIGEPMSDRVAGPGGRVFVVELSSFQLETTHDFHPRAAALLNLTPDHLDRYGTLEAYRRAKERIFLRQGEDDVAVLSRELLEGSPQLPGRARRRVFSLEQPIEDGCYLAGDVVLEVAPGAAPEPLFRTGDVPLAGRHNLENAMAAALMARSLAAPVPDLVRALRTFAGLPHRVERVAVLAGVAFYDDSKGTNMAATLRSLEGFPDGTVHLILGGRNKDADPADLREMVARKARALYLIGEAAGEFEAALRDSAPSERVETLERAVRTAAGRARAGEVVLLSPACASFDQFRNYIHRGETFKALVGELAQEAHG